MDNKLLPQCDKTIYETHFWMRREHPFIFHRDILYHEGRQFTPSLHVNIEVLHILEGSGQVIFNGIAKDVLPGDIVVINSYVAHTIITSGTIRSDCLILDHNFCVDNGIDLSQLEFVPVIHNPKAIKLYKAFSNEFFSPGPFHRATLRIAVLRLMLYLAKNYSTPKEKDEIQSGIMERIWSAVEFMKDHLNEKLTLDQIAVKSGFSKYYFLRLFKSYTGYTVNTYLTLLRCDKAKQLLQTGDYNIREVADMCGFENFSYFSKVFKEHTGQLPSAVLRNR